MKLAIPNAEELELRTLILDLNGTITVRGQLVEGVAERVEKLKKKGLSVVLFTGDTRGTGGEIAKNLGIEMVETPTANDKKEAAERFGPDTCVTVGNGLIDLGLFQTVRLAIATLQAEGVHSKTLAASHIVVPSVLDALDLLLDEKSLIATLRS